jgi:hypothetical protein
MATPTPSPKRKLPDDDDDVSVKREKLPRVLQFLTAYDPDTVSWWFVSENQANQQDFELLYNRVLSVEPSEPDLDEKHPESDEYKAAIRLIKQSHPSSFDDDDDGTGQPWTLKRIHACPSNSGLWVVQIASDCYNGGVTAFVEDGDDGTKNWQ